MEGKSNVDLLYQNNISSYIVDENNRTTYRLYIKGLNNCNNMINYMFGDCSKLTTLDISNLDTSKVTDMSYMFEDCNVLTTIKGVIDMKSCILYDHMFDGCDNLTGVKIKNPPADFEIKCGIRKDQYEIVD